MYRDRSKIIRRIVIIGILLLALGGGAVALHSVYTVRTVYVEGNVHYTEDEIMEIVMSGPLGDNSLYLSLKYRDRGIQDIPFVDVMNVSILAPDTIKITVYEKALAGYVKYLDTYMYFDKDGIVVESSSENYEDVPQITGLVFKSIVLDAKLEVGNDAVFSQILELTQAFDKYQLGVKKVYFDSSYNVSLYMGNVKVMLGSAADCNDKLYALKQVSEKLTGMKGTLHLENYDGTTASIIFKKEN